MSYNYPVVFRCWECTVNLPSVEALEVHVWNRHLRTFPYRCAMCGYPALTTKALTTHYMEMHGPNHAIEFKRKVTDELRLWEIVAQSIQVSLPQFDEEEQEDEHEPEEIQLYEEIEEVVEGLDEDKQNGESIWQVNHDDAANGDEIQIIEGIASSSRKTWQQMPSTIDDLNGTITIEEIPQLQMEDGSGQTTIIHEGNLDENGVVGLEEELVLVEEDGGQHKTVSVLTTDHLISDYGDMDVVAEEEVVDDQGIMMEEGDQTGQGTSFDMYADQDYFDEEGYTWQYTEQQGSQMMEEHETGTKISRDVRFRILKDRHMDMVVRKVAHSKTRRRLPQMYTCEECGKVLKYPSKIEEHRRSHTGEKPHKCPICGQGFTQKGAMKAHIRLHTGEKPYDCSWECGKSFSSSSALKLHEKTHSGEKPFHCDFCGQLFGKKYHMERHVQRLHMHQLHPTRERPRIGLEAAEEDEPVVRQSVLEVIDEVRTARLARIAKQNGLYEERGS